MTEAGRHERQYGPWAAAVHESGHAVCFIRLFPRAVRIKAIEIDTHKRRFCTGETTVLTRRGITLSPIPHAVCLLAGPAAEFQFTGAARVVGCDDWRQAEALLTDSGTRIARVWDLARDTVTAFQPEIERLARVLYVRRRLDGAGALAAI